MQYLDEKGLLRGMILDYGCGRGFDVCYYGLKYWIDGYDPYWELWRQEREETFDTIVCNYVLNVVSKEKEFEIIKKIKSILKPNGKAYFTVRRDIKKDYTVDDYVQRVVILDLPSLYHNKGKFEIYTLDKN